MNNRLIQLLTFLLFVTLSSLAFAGAEGESCNSKKGHKELSAEVLKNNDKKYFWSKFFDQNEDKTASNDNKTIKKLDNSDTSGLIES